MTISWLLGSNETAFTGEVAALTAAFLWAAATLMFGKLGQQLSPVVLNGVKGVCAIAFITLTLGARARFQPAATPDLPLNSIVLLLLSGGIGIGLGDTAYFAAINVLGARRALLLETLAPPMAAIMAWICLSERLGLSAIAGIALTLLGIAWVISERVPPAPRAMDAAREVVSRQPLGKKADARPIKRGVQIALLAAFCQAAGAVLSRAALADTGVDPLWSALLRLMAGLVFMGALARWQGRQNRLAASPIHWRQRFQVLAQPRLFGMVALTAFFGTYLAIWLQQAALKYTQTGIAQSLLATSPLFVLPMAVLLGERVSARAVAGVAIAISGVWLLFAS